MSILEAKSGCKGGKLIGFGFLPFMVFRVVGLVHKEVAEFMESDKDSLMF